VRRAVLGEEIGTVVGKLGSRSAGQRGEEKAP
jgi:hypothetical protein